MENETAEKNNPYTIAIAIVVAGALLASAWLYNAQNPANENEKIAAVNQPTALTPNINVSELAVVVLPTEGVVLPAVWGDLGAKLISVGAIDEIKFRALYGGRGQFTAEYEKLLVGNNTDKLKITKDNAGYLLNLFWALGLASKNPILDSGEMANPRYGGKQNFASTAGWTMAKDDPMAHYSRHKFFSLTAEQQALVDKVSQGIYRPCCDNSTHFPDCNHGMAMLGLLELMASQGASEEEMWQAALAVNVYWFPDTYLTIATYLKNKGVEWQDAKPQEILGASYSSASGYARVAAQVTQPEQGGGGSCGV